MRSKKALVWHFATTKKETETGTETGVGTENGTETETETEIGKSFVGADERTQKPCGRASHGLESG